MVGGRFRRWTERRGLLRRSNLRRGSLERSELTSAAEVPVGNVDARAHGAAEFPPNYVRSYDEGRPRK
jgi:hypothetical protein